jgi:hypothetical protein
MWCRCQTHKENQPCQSISSKPTMSVKGSRVCSKRAAPAGAPLSKSCSVGGRPGRGLLLCLQGYRCFRHRGSARQRHRCRAFIDHQCRCGRHRQGHGPSDPGGDRRRSEEDPHVPAAGTIAGTPSRRRAVAWPHPTHHVPGNCPRSTVRQGSPAGKSGREISMTCASSRLIINVSAAAMWQMIGDFGATWRNRHPDAPQICRH